MDNVVCWNCMKAEVSTAGETCDKCLYKWPRRAKQAHEMTLEELIATGGEHNGAVKMPGWKYEYNSTKPRGLVDGRGRLSYDYPANRKTRF